MVLLIILLLLPPDKAAVPTDAMLADFGSFTQAVGDDIAIVDPDGAEYKGVLRSATASELILQNALGERTFNRDVISSARRVADSRKDGFIRGAILGALLGSIALAHPEGYTHPRMMWLDTTVVCAGLGYIFDAKQSNGGPLYRAGANTSVVTTRNALKPAMKLSLRF